MNKKKKDLIDKVADEIFKIEWKYIYINNEITNYQISNSGMIWSNNSNRLLKPYSNPKGYLFIEINDCSKSIHRLVALAFIPNPDNKPEVNHIDGNKSNNNVNNLEWVTHEENMGHAKNNKLIKNVGKGIDNPANIYSEEQIHSVCKLLEHGENSNIFISEKTGVSASCINQIKFNDKWKHIASQYNLPVFTKRGPNKPLELREDVIKLILEDNKNKEIIRLLNLPDDSKSRSYIKNIRTVLKKSALTSTTIENSINSNDSNYDIEDRIIFEWELAS